MAPLSTPRPQPVYNCKQNELYSAALIGWKSFSDNQAAFEAFNAIYTVAYGTAMKAAVMSAKAMPDEYQRNELHKDMRKVLKNKSVDVLIAWQQLDSFIRNGFSEEDYEDKRLAAGSAYYEDAVNEDWESVDSLLEDASAFIAGNPAELSTGGMLPTFASSFATLKTDFEAAYENFTDAEQDAPELTDAKITANNTVYKNLLKMFDDGQKIFRNSAAVKARFTFSHVLELIGGGSASDSAGYDVDDYVIAAGASVVIEDELPAPDDLIYVRLVSGTEVIACTTDGTTGACTSGYTFALGVTYKGAFSGLGLDLSKPHVQVTNPGTEDAILRAGRKK